MRRSLIHSLSRGCLVVALAVALPAAAQEGQPDPAAMQEMMMKLISPGAPHEHLAALAGKWNAALTWYMEGEQTSAGTCEYEMVLGGRYLVGRFRTTYMGQPFEGLSVDGYDNGAQEFFSLWFDTMGTGYFLSKGKAPADGKTFTLNGTMVMGPMEIPTRSESVMVDKDTMKFTMWHVMGGQEAKAMEAVYTRAH